jgi:hypothetical protein
MKRTFLFWRRKKTVLGLFLSPAQQAKPLDESEWVVHT